MSNLFGDDSKGQFEGTAKEGRTDNHGVHSGDDGKMYGQYNQYSNHGDDPHERFWYNCATGQSGYHGENLTESEKKAAGRDIDENSLFRWN